MADSKAADKNITVVGVGRLGICFALVLEKKGYNVVGVDLAQPYCDKINNRTLRSNEPSVEEYLKTCKNLRMTTSLDEGVKHSDVLFILVDTPSTGGERHYDHSKLGSVLMALNSLKVENKHMVIGCTIIPGYTATVGRQLIGTARTAHSATTLSSSPRETSSTVSCDPTWCSSARAARPPETACRSSTRR